MKQFFVLALLCSFIAISAQQNYDFSKVDSILPVIPSYEPGLSVGIVKNGELIYSNQQGMANLEHDIPIHENSAFGMASIAKQFTSACIGILVKDNQITIDDPINSFIPELPIEYQDITIKHLLGNTSGIRNYNTLQNLLGFDYEHDGYTNDDIYKLMVQQKGLNNKPGERMFYSNSNYVLLTLIIERVSGKSFAQFAQDQIFHPLQMKHTKFKTDNESIIKHKVRSYYKGKEGYRQPSSLTVCVGAGGLISTLGDMAIWSNVFTDNNSDYSDIAKFISTRDALNNGSMTNYARGVFVSDHKEYHTVHHSGMDLGLRTQLLIIPDEELSILVFANSEHINVVNISYWVMDALLDTQEAEQEATESYKHSTKELKKFEGYYMELNSDLLMHVRLDSGRLETQTNFGTYYTWLKETGEAKFQRHYNASIAYNFKPKGDINCDLRIDFGGAPFHFERIELADSKEINTMDYVGTFFSEELQVEYQIRLEGGELFLSYPFNENVKLVSRQRDTWGSQNRTRYSFSRDQNGGIVAFKLSSEGTISNILFEKK